MLMVGHTYSTLRRGAADVRIIADGGPVVTDAGPVATYIGSDGFRYAADGARMEARRLRRPGRTVTIEGWYRDPRVRVSVSALPVGAPARQPMTDLEQRYTPRCAVVSPGWPGWKACGPPKVLLAVPSDGGGTDWKPACKACVHAATYGEGDTN